MYEPDISSPKSVLVSPYKNQTYVNSLEDYKTLVYDSTSFKRSMSFNTSLKVRIRIYLLKRNLNLIFLRAIKIQTYFKVNLLNWLSVMEVDIYGFPTTVDLLIRLLDFLLRLQLWTSDFKIVRVFLRHQFWYVEVSPGVNI